LCKDTRNVVGSNFLDERGPIAGVGPITVHPVSQNQAIGRQLMGAVLDRASERGAAGVRLLQRRRWALLDRKSG
jgi:predicted N-acetyltransferase YhbS